MLNLTRREDVGDAESMLWFQVWSQVNSVNRKRKKVERELDFPPVFFPLLDGSIWLIDLLSILLSCRKRRLCRGDGACTISADFEW